MKEYFTANDSLTHPKIDKNSIEAYGRRMLEIDLEKIFLSNLKYEDSIIY